MITVDQTQKDMINEIDMYEMSVCVSKKLLNGDILIDTTLSK